jgi:T-complex protein 1 subunit zeta
MSSLQLVNANADIIRKAQALAVNINAAKGLQEVLKSNLGPKGTIKMLVGGAGQVKLTKDGAVLLHEMQIQHPTAAMIGRSATAQDDMVGDGTTTNVLFIGELMRQAERYIGDGVHPRVLVDGIELAKGETLRFLEDFKVPKVVDHELSIQVARSSLQTKIHPDLANPLCEILVKAVETISKPRKEADAAAKSDGIDLHMIEIMHMQHKMSTESKLVQGLVLDHGGRYSDLPSNLENCYILCLNVSLEYEKTEVHSGFFWSNAEQREKLIASERQFTDDKVLKIIELKRKLCTAENGKNFVVVNQKGIDPPSLELLANDGIIGIRRAKKRNGERIPLACGGRQLNSVDDLTEADLGFAKHVYEQVLGDDKYTFIEGVENPFSCTILIKGPNDYSIAQTKEAIRDGLRAIKNAKEDKALVPGGGAFEIACAEHLTQFARKSVSGKAKLGVNAYADALLIVPRTLAQNSGFDAQDTLLKVQEAHIQKGEAFGVDCQTGEPLPSAVANVWDNYMVKRQFMNIAPVLAQQLLLVDEVMRAGKNMKGNGAPQE